MLTLADCDQLQTAILPPLMDQLLLIHGLQRHLVVQVKALAAALQEVADAEEAALAPAQGVNADLLAACRAALAYLDGGMAHAPTRELVRAAIARADRTAPEKQT